MVMVVGALRLTNRVQALLVCLALLGVFGPHLLILGYKAAGIRPPGALVFFCLLHHGAAGSAQAPHAWWFPAAHR